MRRTKKERKNERVRKEGREGQRKDEDRERGDDESEESGEIYMIVPGAVYLTLYRPVSLSSTTRALRDTESPGDKRRERGRTRSEGVVR